MLHVQSEPQPPGVQNPPAQVTEHLVDADRHGFSRNYALETPRVVLESSQSIPDLNALTLHENEYTSSSADTSNVPKVWSYSPLTNLNLPPRSFGGIPSFTQSASITFGAGHACPRNKPAMDDINALSKASLQNKSVRIIGERTRQNVEAAKKEPCVKSEAGTTDLYNFQFGSHPVIKSLSHHTTVENSPFQNLATAQATSKLLQDIPGRSTKHEHQKASRTLEDKANSDPILIPHNFIDTVDGKTRCYEHVPAANNGPSISDGMTDSATIVPKNKAEVYLAENSLDLTSMEAHIVEPSAFHTDDILLPDRIAVIDVSKKDAVATSVLGAGSQFSEGYKSPHKTELDGISLSLSNEIAIDGECRPSDGEQSRTTPNRRGKGAASGSSSSPTSNGFLSSSPYFDSHQKGRKRPLGTDGSCGDEDEKEEERPSRSRKLCDDIAEPFTGRRLACPFYLNDPFRYRTTSIGTTYVDDTYQVCAFGAGFKDIKSLKEHLKRRHQIPIRCARCAEDFTTKAEVDRHLRITPICQVVPERPTKGMTAEVEEKLKYRKKDGRKLSEEEQAAEIYSWLFPDDLPRAIGFYRDWTFPTPSGVQELNLFWEQIDKFLPQKLAARLNVNAHLRELCMYPEFQDNTIHEIIAELKTSIGEMSKRSRGLSIASGSDVPSVASYPDSAYGTISRSVDGEYQRSLQSHLVAPPQLAPWSNDDQTGDPRLLMMTNTTQGTSTDSNLLSNDDFPNGWDGSLGSS